MAKRLLALTALAWVTAFAQAQSAPQYRGSYSASTSYSLNDTVAYGSPTATLFASLAASNLGNTPTTNPTKWLQLTPSFLVNGTVNTSQDFLNLANAAGSSVQSGGGSVGVNVNLSTGVSGGQAVVGGTAPSDALVLQPYNNGYTSYATLQETNGGGAAGSLGQLGLTLDAAVDSQYYFNPVVRYTAHNSYASPQFQSVFETGVEGCYSNAGTFVATGPCSAYFGYHWYLFNNTNNTTALDVNGAGYMSLGYPTVALQGISSPQYLTMVEPTIASAGTIAPAKGILHVSGAARITTITPPTGMSSTLGGCLTLIADGAWSTSPGGNIETALTATIGSLYQACYDGSLWYIK